MTEKKIKFRGKSYTCNIELCLDLIGGKWKAIVLYHLLNGPMRSGDLKRMLPKISDKMFTQTVRQLELDKLIVRKVYPVVPPKVEYYLSKDGESLEPILKQMCAWGENFRKSE